MSGRVMDQAFVTLATNDSYAIGALVLGNSLRRVGTTRSLVVMVTSDVSQTFRQHLHELFDVVSEVNVFDSQDTVNLELLTRPDLGVTFTKLHCWRLTQFNKCVFMDADTLVLQNIDELFDRDELSAAPDAGWPDCFNSGLFVFKPNNETYAALLNFALTHGSFDGGDQGLLNMYFSDWATKDIKKRLPFLFNVVAQTFYSYLPAFKQYGKDTKVLHFIGPIKPWHTSYNVATGQVETTGDMSNYAVLLKLWWNIYLEYVRPKLEGASDISQGSYNLCSYTKQQLGDSRRQYNWERGQIDYLGIDSFENILGQLNRKLV
jgi:glycogenin glucosyltransferase